MSTTVKNTYQYFGNLKLDPTVLEQCKELLITLEEQMPDKHTQGMYKDFEPIQCGFRKKGIEKFEIPGIDINKSNFQIILQQPGRMLPWHIDEFKSLIAEGNYKGAKTYLCFLDDWVPGQTFGTEHDTYTHWKAGDTICWDYLVWHFSSNSSTKPKYTLQIIEGYD